MSFFRTLGTTAQAMPREERRVLALEGRDVPLLIRRNDRARRLTLRLEPGGKGLRLSVPPRVRRSEVDAFLFKHHDWVAERLRSLPAAPLVELGAMVPIEGIPHRIEHSGRLRGTTKRIGGDPPTLLVSGPAERTGGRVVDWLKQKARERIAASIEHHTPTLGHHPTAVRVKDTRSRWGSCSSAGALSFSWRLAMAPPWVLDYLVAHEMAHLIHMNHGREFWALTHRLCPRMDEAKAWLKEEGQALHAYDFG